MAPPAPPFMAAPIVGGNGMLLGTLMEFINHLPR